MTSATVTTYRPAWTGSGDSRVTGTDEDAVTMAVAAGTAAIKGQDREVARVVFVTRQPPLLEGGNAAALLGGLGLPPITPVVECLGGAPAALDALALSTPSTLVIGADVDGTAAAGAWFSQSSVALTEARQVNRSLPVRARGADGLLHVEDDPRLLRERGLRSSLDAMGLEGKPVAIAGAPHRDASAFCAADPPVLPTTGAASIFFALAALVERHERGLVVAVEQASASAAVFDSSRVAVQRIDRPAVELPASGMAAAGDIRLSFPAYERAFEPKVRWEAARCSSCGTLAFPPRLRCLECGEEKARTRVSLPRSGVVYTTTTVHVTVPKLTTPYQLAVVALDDVDVRALVQVTDSMPGSVAIGARGTMVFRRIATRQGVPDYGYSFAPKLS